MKAIWQAREARWRRFEEWEHGETREQALDFREAIAWMAEAWEVASRHSEWWNSRQSAEEHWAHLAEVRRRLAFVSGSR